jgi:hypothetical protein
MFTTTRAAGVLLSVATFSAPPPGCDTFHGSCPGLLPDLVPGPPIYAYALHGEFHAWRRDGVGNWFDPIRIATGECECESDSGGLMDVVELQSSFHLLAQATLGCLRA